MDPKLLEWAVYRSLDTKTNARFDHTGETADARLSRWRAEAPSDSRILAELTTIYGYNPSLRGADEPIVVVSAVHRPKGKGEKTPALWCSLSDRDPNIRYSEKKKDWEEVPPAAHGAQIVAVVRKLIAASEPPSWP